MIIQICCIVSVLYVQITEHSLHCVVVLTPNDILTFQFLLNFFCASEDQIRSATFFFSAISNSFILITSMHSNQQLLMIDLKLKRHRWRNLSTREKETDSVIC